MADQDDTMENNPINPAEEQQQVENPSEIESSTTVEPPTGTGITPEEFDAYFERKAAAEAAAADTAAANAAAEKVEKMKVTDDDFDNFFLELDPDSTLHNRDISEFVIDPELQLARSPLGRYYTADGIQVEPYEGQCHHTGGIDSDQEMDDIEDELLQFEDAPLQPDTAEPSSSVNQDAVIDGTTETAVSAQYRLWIESARETIDLFSRSNYDNNKELVQLHLKLTEEHKADLENVKEGVTYRLMSQGQTVHKALMQHRAAFLQTLENFELNEIARKSIEEVNAMNAAAAEKARKQVEKEEQEIRRTAERIALANERQRALMQRFEDKILNIYEECLSFKQAHKELRLKLIALDDDLMKETGYTFRAFCKDRLPKLDRLTVYGIITALQRADEPAGIIPIETRQSYQPETYPQQKQQFLQPRIPTQVVHRPTVDLPSTRRPASPIEPAAPLAPTTVHPSPFRHGAPLGFIKMKRVPRAPCTFCAGSHHPFLCTTVPTKEGRLTLLNQRRICITCLQPHDGDCKQGASMHCKWFNCLAKGDHNPALCPAAQWPITSAVARRWHEDFTRLVQPLQEQQ